MQNKKKLNFFCNTIKLETIILIVGTRGSQLALAQTKQVCQDLTKITGEQIDLEIIKTKGDKHGVQRSFYKRIGYCIVRRRS